MRVWPILGRRWRRALLRGLALLAGLATFLRLPLHDSPVPTQWWPPELPEARMPEARAEDDVVSASAATSAHRSGYPDEAAPLDGPFLFRSPARAQLRPLAAADWGVANLLERRLQDLDELGDEGARADALYLLGVERQRTLEFGAAADYFEAFAFNPTGAVAIDEAATSLENAIVYRSALGQTDRALADAARFVELYGATSPRAATRVAFEASELGDESFLAALRRRRLPPAERIQAEVRFALQVHGADPAEARRAFRRAERVWQQEGGALMATSPGLDPAEWIEELSRTREALAEARFFVANRRFLSLRARRAPAFKGSADVERVERWVERRLRPWLTQRLEGAARVERAMDHVDTIGLSTFSVAAASRRGELYADLHRELRQALPPVVSADEGRILLPAEHIDDDPVVRARIVQPAIDRFESCMQLASHTRAYGEWSERCADGLAQWISRYRHHELIPSAPWER